MYEIEIPEENYLRLLKRINKAAQRAGKFKLPVPKIETAERFQKRFLVHDALAEIRGFGEDKRSIFLPMIKVRITGLETRVGEWRVVGWRYPVRVGGERKYVDVGHVPESKKGQPLCCEHCGYKRNRLATIMMHHVEDDRVAEVGTTCMSAFTGVPLSRHYLEGVAETSSIVKELYELARQDYLSGNFDFGEEAKTVLAVAYRYLSEHPFVSSSEARIQGFVPTWKKVRDLLVRYRDPECPPEAVEVTAADFLAADDMVAFFSEARDNEFLYTANEVIGRGIAGMRDIAVLTGAAKIYRNHQERARDRKVLQALAKSSVHVGEPGQRIEFVGKVKAVKSFEGHYGRVFYVSMLDGDGNVLFWKSNRADGLQIGNAYEMKGTVKEHRQCPKGAFEGMAETVLSRVSVLHEIGPVDESEREVPLDEDDAEELDAFLQGMGI